MGVFSSVTLRTEVSKKVQKVACGKYRASSCVGGGGTYASDVDEKNYVLLIFKCMQYIFCSLS